MVIYSANEAYLLPLCENSSKMVLNVLVLASLISSFLTPSEAMSSHQWVTTSSGSRVSSTANRHNALFEKLEDAHLSEILTRKKISFARDLRSQSKRSKNHVDNHVARSLISSGSTSFSSDAQYLMEFKNSIHSDPFKGMANWNTTNNIHKLCRNWTGVSCRRNRVVGLDLGNMHLQGTIASSLGNLTFLSTLNLSFNSFTGFIPSTLGDCIELSLVDLSNNSLGGPIPSELGRLKKLQELDLKNNNLTGNIPLSLVHCAALTVLDLKNNSLSGSIPGDLGKLWQLQSVFLDNNNVTGDIPATIGQLSHLQWFSADYNYLSGQIPATIGNLSQLKWFSAQSNNLSGSIPVEMGDLNKLRTLWLDFNQLVGTIPASLANCSQLSVLSLGSNHFSGTIPPDFGRLSKLALFTVDSKDSPNGLNGSIPGTLSNCSKLEFLSLAYNSISSIDLHFWSITNLKKLTLTGNVVAETLPLEVGNCKALEWLEFSENRLSGTIPDSLGLLPLKWLDLSLNILSGIVPSSLGRLGELQVLDLSGNINLNGSVPVTLSNCTKLLKLLLRNNNFSGSLDIDFSKLSVLENLSLSWNNLNGTLPSSLGFNRSMLILLDLGSNSFTGSFPTNYDQGNFSSLQGLILASNNLDGAIPSWIGELKQLRVLDLSANNFSGAIPNDLRSLEGFKVIRYSDPANYTGHDCLVVRLLRSCFVTGGESFYFPSGNTYFDLSQNALTGSVPDELGALVALTYLNLSGNRLEGNIPPSLANLDQLATLDLSSNFLVGNIPVGFEDFQYLRTLALASNNLSGEIPARGTFLTVVGSDSFLPGNPYLCGPVVNRNCTDATASTLPVWKSQNTFADMVSFPAFCLGILMGFVSVLFTIRLWKKARKAASKNHFQEPEEYIRKYGLFCDTKAAPKHRTNKDKRLS